MTVYDNEDEVSSASLIRFRLNKLKSIVRYFCIFVRRIETETDRTNQDTIVFQRGSVILQDSVNPKNNGNHKLNIILNTETNDEIDI